jgi:soluble lytic murein transglycosylase
VAQHGDPRDPKVDAVDWVERIPFAETRDYVQNACLPLRNASQKHLRQMQYP